MENKTGFAMAAYPIYWCKKKTAGQTILMISQIIGMKSKP
jgi:hypothetical protein